MKSITASLENNPELKEKAVSDFVEKVKDRISPKKSANDSLPLSSYLTPKNVKRETKRTEFYEPEDFATKSSRKTPQNKGKQKQVEEELEEEKKNYWSDGEKQTNEKDNNVKQQKLTSSPAPVQNMVDLINTGEEVPTRKVVTEEDITQQHRSKNQGTNFLRTEYEHSQQNLVRMKTLYETIHHRGTKAFCNTEQFLINPIFDLKVIEFLVGLFKVHELPNTNMVLRSVIENLLPVNLVFKRFNDDSYHFTRPDGFCAYHSQVQLISNWNYYKSNGSFLNDDKIPALKDDMYQLPKNAEKLLGIFKQILAKMDEKRDVLPIGVCIPQHDRDRTMYEVIENVIKEITPPDGRLVKNNIAPCCSKSDYYTWGPVHLYPYAFLLDTNIPFVLLNTYRSSETDGNINSKFLLNLHLFSYIYCFS